MMERSLGTVSTFLDSAYREGMKCLDKELLERLLDIRQEVNTKLYQAQRDNLNEKE